MEKRVAIFKYIPLTQLDRHILCWSARKWTNSYAFNIQLSLHFVENAESFDSKIYDVSNFLI